MQDLKNTSARMLPVVLTWAVAILSAIALSVEW